MDAACLDALGGLPCHVIIAFTVSQRDLESLRSDDV